MPRSRSSNLPLIAPLAEMRQMKITELRTLARALGVAATSTSLLKAQIVAKIHRFYMKHHKRVYQKACRSCDKNGVRYHAYQRYIQGGDSGGDPGGSGGDGGDNGDFVGKKPDIERGFSDADHLDLNEMSHKFKRLSRALADSLSATPGSPGSPPPSPAPTAESGTECSFRQAVRTWLGPANSSQITALLNNVIWTCDRRTLERIFSDERFTSVCEELDIPVRYFVFLFIEEAQYCEACAVTAAQNHKFWRWRPEMLIPPKERKISGKRRDRKRTQKKDAGVSVAAPPTPPPEGSEGLDGRFYLQDECEDLGFDSWFEGTMSGLPSPPMLDRVKEIVWTDYSASIRC